MNWAEQSANSHYQTAVAIRDRLHEGDVQDAARGIEELIDALSRADRRALRSQLIRLMAHVIKWNTQPHRRSRSWIATIRTARDEIIGIQQDTPSVTDNVIRDLWQKCFERAKDEAEGEMNQDSPLNALSWDEVFKTEYKL